MNLLSVMAGELAGTVIQAVGTKLFEQIKPFNQSSFIDTFTKYSEANRQVTVADLNLSRETALQLLELRDYALSQGRESLTVSINDDEYLMHTQDFTFEKLT
jgi:hypothetical protein